MNLQEQYKRILNRNGKILNISHKDLDGAGSTIVTKNVFNNIDFEYLKYGEVNEFLKKLNYNNYDVVLLTDISPESIEGFVSDKIFLLDHHDSALKYNCPEKNKIVVNGKSATKLCKEFFENLFKLDLSYLNSFVELVNDYDMWVLKDPKSWCLNELYFFYYDSDFRNRFKNGDVKFNTQETNYVLERKKKLTKLYQSLNVYEMTSINACFFVGNEFINDLCHNLMKDKNFQISICINSKSNSCSVRSINENIHVGEILQELKIGGGHKQASAFRLDDNETPQKKLDMIEKYLYEHFPELRLK